MINRTRVDVQLVGDNSKLAKDFFLQRLTKLVDQKLKVDEKRLKVLDEFSIFDEVKWKSLALHYRGYEMDFYFGKEYKFDAPIFYVKDMSVAEDKKSFEIIKNDLLIKNMDQICVFLIQYVCREINITNIIDSIFSSPLKNKFQRTGIFLFVEKGSYHNDIFVRNEKKSYFGLFGQNIGKIDFLFHEIVLPAGIEDELRKDVAGGKPDKLFGHRLSIISDFSEHTRNFIFQAAFAKGQKSLHLLCMQSHLSGMKNVDSFQKSFPQIDSFLINETKDGENFSAMDRLILIKKIFIDSMEKKRKTIKKSIIRLNKEINVLIKLHEIDFFSSAAKNDFNIIKDKYNSFQDKELIDSLRILSYFNYTSSLFDFFNKSSEFYNSFKKNFCEYIYEQYDRLNKYQFFDVVIEKVRSILRVGKPFLLGSSEVEKNIKNILARVLFFVQFQLELDIKAENVLNKKMKDKGLLSEVLKKNAPISLDLREQRNQFLSVWQIFLNQLSDSSRERALINESNKMLEALKSDDVRIYQPALCELCMLIYKNAISPEAFYFEVINTIPEKLWLMIDSLADNLIYDYKKSFELQLKIENEAEPSAPEFEEEKGYAPSVNDSDSESSLLDEESIKSEKEKSIQNDRFKDSQYLSVDLDEKEEKKENDFLPPYYDDLAENTISDGSSGNSRSTSPASLITRRNGLFSVAADSEKPAPTLEETHQFLIETHKKCNQEISEIDVEIAKLNKAREAKLKHRDQLARHIDALGKTLLIHENLLLDMNNSSHLKKG